LEAQSFQQNSGTITDKTISNSKAYTVQEPVNSLIGEGSEDAFWVILRELRAVNEKLDLLSSRMESSSLTMNSDKSSH
jgi:hypothetical protein